MTSPALEKFLISIKDFLSEAQFLMKFSQPKDSPVAHNLHIIFRFFFLLLSLQQPFLICHFLVVCFVLKEVPSLAVLIKVIYELELLLFSEFWADFKPGPGAF